jgi:hypothetical protein
MYYLLVKSAGLLLVTRPSFFLDLSKGRIVPLRNRCSGRGIKLAEPNVRAFNLAENIPELKVS